MSRLITYAFAVVVAGGVLALASSPAISSGGQGTAIVRLQATTPGTTQTGHMNLSGTGIFGRLDVSANLVSISSTGVLRVLNTATTGQANAIYAESSSPGSYAVFGMHTSTNSGAGGYFGSVAPNGIGVRGEAGSVTGTTYGGFFLSQAPMGYGVFSVNNHTTGASYAVYGRNHSPNGFAIYGHNQGNGWAGYFTGKTYVGGNLGIGTLIPATALDVAGTASMLGFKMTTDAGLGKVLTSDATGVGTWQSLAGLPPTGAAGGDLSGTYPNPTLANLTTSLAKVSGGVMFTNGTLVGIGTSTGIGAGRFVVSQTTSAYGGMYVNTSSATGLPFYGYGLGGAATAYHYLDGNDGNKWKLNNNGVKLVVQTNGNVGLGTTAPDARLHAVATAGNGIHAVSPSSTDSGVWGENTGGGYGVSGSTNSARAGVWGNNFGTGEGVWGSAGSGIGVYGSATAPHGTGVFGISDSTSGLGVGVFAHSKGADGTAVYGYVDGGGSPTAISGWCDSVSGWAGYFTGNVNVTSSLYTSTLRVSSGAGAGKVLTSDALGNATWQNNSFSPPVNLVASLAGGSILTGDNTNGAVNSIGLTGKGVTGVLGSTQSTGGWGVRAIQSAQEGTAIYALTSSSLGQGIGIHGQSQALDGTGIFGEASAAAGSAFGVRGSTLGTGGTGVLGWSKATSGTNYGVFGRSDSVNGYGGYFVGRGYFSGGVGINVAAPQSALHVNGDMRMQDIGNLYLRGGSDTGHGIGWFGLGKTFNGENVDGPVVFGYAGGRLATKQTGDKVQLGWDIDSVNIGAEGGTAKLRLGGPGSGEQITSNRTNNGLNMAGLDFRTGAGGQPRMAITNGGNVGIGTQSPLVTFDVLGIVSASVKAFHIDHPLDPENKFLNHGCVESNEYKNLYDGTVETDAKGFATVEVPDWFMALNENFRYQLTIIDESESADFVQARISKKLRDGSFQIRTSHPAVEVSWQVTGIRKDVFAKANPLDVEAPKPKALKGKYLHPELYGRDKP